MFEFIHYDDITDVIESDLDCLSLDALVAEWLVEDETGLPSCWSDDDD